MIKGERMEAKVEDLARCSRTAESSQNKRTSKGVWEGSKVVEVATDDRWKDDRQLWMVERDVDVKLRGGERE